MLNTITVTQLNTYVKSLIENDVRLQVISVSGEISNLKNHYSSGHWYFTLKDRNSSVRCVMFRASASRVKFDVTDGMAVVLRGRVSLYEKDGQYQFYAEDMQTVGEGDLALAFKQTKEKLEREGLFDSSSKRELVKFPRRIAVITSDTGAAVRDIINITASRCPQCEIVMCPVLVQGENAAADMIKTLDRVYSLDGIDTVIIGRGGGSSEDLHCFNDEMLARKIYDSPFPVISAVGHETDFTICDFVADVRASTPSHAAELAVPDVSDLRMHIFNLRRLISRRVTDKFNLAETRLDYLKKHSVFLKSERLFEKRQQEVDGLYDKILNSVNRKLQNACHRAEKLFLEIDALSPLKIMTRGFATVTKDGVQVKTVKALETDDNIKIRFFDGTADCTVKSVDKSNISERE